MNEPERIEITATSHRTAECTPINLRGGESHRTRLVFIPTIVSNDANRTASLRGTFAYQRRRAGGQWENADSIQLNQLMTGEGVRLELKAEEVLQLHTKLSALYEAYSREGIGYGTRKYLLVESGAAIESILNLFSRAGDSESIVAVIDWINTQDQGEVMQYFRGREETLAKLDNSLGIARLTKFIADARHLLADSREDDWQRLLQRDSWAISQLFAEPIVILAGQAYVGGKNYRNREGNVADFLFRNSITSNCLLVEIKRPDTPLIVDDSTARNGVLNVSKEVTGAVQQVLQNSYSLTRDYRNLVGDDPEFTAFRPKLLLVAGSTTSLTSSEMRKSFEFYRGEQRTVQIVTFDELVEKAISLLALLRSADEGIR